jgi:hypothetical protein
VLLIACGSDGGGSIECDESGTIDVEDSLMIDLYRDTSIGPWPIPATLQFEFADTTGWCALFLDEIDGYPNAECSENIEMSMIRDEILSLFVDGFELPYGEHMINVSVRALDEQMSAYNPVYYRLKGDSFRYVSVVYFDETTPIENQDSN